MTINQKPLSPSKTPSRQETQDAAQPPRRSWPKKLLRVLVYLVLGLCLMITGAFLALQVQPVQNAAKGTITRVITSAIASHTQAVCRIEKISGNLVSGFTITGISLSSAATDELLLSAEEVEVSYLLPMLFEKKLWINRLSVSGLSVALINKADGSWNMAALSPPSSSTPPPEKIKPLPPLSEFHVRLRRLDVRDSTVLLSVFDDTGNSIHRFTGINCQARVDMKLGRESDIFAAIDRLSVRSSLPEINITSLSGDIYYHMNENRFDFKNTAIRGEKCDFTINGSLAILENAPDRTMLDQIVMDLRADVPAMCLGEFGRAFPIDMPDTDIVSGDLAVKGPVSRMDCKVDLKMDKCHVVSQGLVSINDNYDVSLDLKGRIGGLDLAKLPALDLDFLPGDLNTDKFSLVWRDIGMPSQSGRISLHVTPSKLWEYAIDEAEITTEINDPDMSFKQLNIATPYGKMSGTLKLVGILSGSGDKRIEIDQDIKKLDLAELLKDNHYASAINGNVQTTIQIPESYDAEGITAEAVCRIETSKIMGVDIKGADAEAVWGEKMVTLKRLDVKTAFGSASVTGDVSIKDRTCRLKAGAELPDLGLIKPFLKKLPKDIRLSGDVSMTADVTGPWEEPDITATATGRDMAWNQITAGSLTTQGRWRGSIEDFSASADASLGNIQMGKVQANALNIAAALTPAAIHADIDLQGDREARLNLSGDIRQWMAPVKTIEITKMTLAAFDQPPLVNQGPLTANLSPDMITIDSLNLASGPATLNVKGKARLTPKGDVSAVMALRNMELSRLSGFLASGDKLRGQISSDIKLSGVMGNPVIRMDMSLEEAAFDKYSISEAVAFISYADSRAVLAASAGRNGAKLVDASGTASGSLSLLPFVFAPEPESLNLVLNIDDVDISWISELIDHPEYGVTGRLSANANLSGDFLNPRLEGRMDLAEGTLNLKKQGLTYDTLTADIEFSTDSITIKEVAIDGDKEGSLQLSGSLTHDRFVLRDFNIQAKGKDLFIPFRGGIQAWVNPDLTLSGDMLNPKIEGRIRVVKGRVNLDRLSDQQPSEIKIISADIPKNGVIEIPEEDLEPLSAFDPLTADIILDISKDCWLRGKDTQVEIKGNVQLKKDPRQPFVLFGGLNTVRGTYRFRGKLFQITQGELMFVGQEDLNPPVNIEARTEVDDVTILIRLTGTFQHLNLDFDSDPPMDQADIISYILFGRSPEALSDQETFKAEEMALSFTGQMAADKIKDVVGEALGIDYLNISTGSSGLRQGSLSMGKYLLPKVFVVFRQGFSDQNSQQFEVSYEINKYFDIQSQIDNEQTSALDLIWKYEF